jgi:hypothetical protein
VLRFQLLVLLAAFGDVFISPIERVSHVEVVLGHARSITDRVRDHGAVRLNEVDLLNDQTLEKTFEVSMAGFLPLSGSSSCRLP